MWSDKTILQALKNPSQHGYEIKVKNPEITFLGVQEQPDFGMAYLTFYPKDRIIELKSLKMYFCQFRNTILSYERLINVIYDDLMSVYQPVRLRIIMIFNPRGGISSRLVIDSDWSCRGGKEEFKDWVGLTEEW